MPPPSRPRPIRGVAAPARSATSSPATLRAFVRNNTRLVPVPEVPGVRLHLADDVALAASRAAAVLGRADLDLPYWAFAWAGGLAIARYLAEHPDEVAGRHVLDLATGSGLCAIVAARAGATSVLAIDIDPLSEAAVAVNARANDVRIAFRRKDILGEPPPSADVILAGDVCYQETMAGRMLDWLRLAAAQGSRVLIGDPGRTYLPPDLERLAAYEVRTSRELEPAEHRPSAVYTIPAGVQGRARIEP
jgi:predicted nicotinamide N-methyase